MDKLERVAQALLEVETLDGEQFEALYTGAIDAKGLAEQVREKDAQIQKINEEEAAEYQRIRQEEEEKLAEELAKYDTDYLEDDFEEVTRSGEGKEAIGEDPELPDTEEADGDTSADRDSGNGDKEDRGNL